MHCFWENDKRGKEKEIDMKWKAGRKKFEKD